MHRKTLIALLGAMIIAVVAAGSALASGSGPAVQVQIKTLTKTLRTTTVHGVRGSVTKGGTPRGMCPGNTAAGALTAATRGRWGGKYYASVGGIFITSILGVKPKSPEYWSLYVNGKSSSQGACGVRLRRGQRLLFKVVK